MRYNPFDSYRQFLVRSMQEDSNHFQEVQGKALQGIGPVQLACGCGNVNSFCVVERTTHAISNMLE